MISTGLVWFTLILGAECIFAYFLLFRSYRSAGLSFRIATGAILVAAFALRFYARNFRSADYVMFLSQWVEHFRGNGGFAALSESIGNYNIPYLYFLAFFSYLNVPDLYLIKLLSIFFDIILAFEAMKLCDKMLVSAQPRRLHILTACYLTVFFLPTVFLNGALWGQCDSIYVALALMGIRLALEDRPVLSVVLAALSFGFKLQAVFILPAYAILYFKGKLKLYHALVFPLVYLLLVLPAVLLGRPLIDTLTLYFNQTGSIGSGLNYNSPSFFAIFDGYGGLPVIEDIESASKIGIAAAFFYMAALLGLAFFRRKQLTDKLIIILTALLALGIPFLLPHMHDRYFFAADILFLILAFGAFETAICAFGVQFASLLGYYAFLKGKYLLMMRYGAYALIAVLLYAFTYLFISLSGSDIKAGQRDR